MKGFYLHIDAVLDARFGVVKRLNPESAAALVANGYHTRKGDFFAGVDPAEYRAMYERHEMETLEESFVTNIFQFLYPQVVDVMNEAGAREIEPSMLPIVEVNVWPYPFTTEEIGFLNTMVFSRMGGIIGVKVINKPMVELTPSFCFENYMLMVVYDCQDYLNAHSDELIRKPQPRLTMAAPMVYFNQDPDKDEEVIEHLKRGINSLSLLEAALAPRLGIKFLNVDLFSVVYPDDRVLKQSEEGTSVKEHTLEELESVLKKQAQGN